MQIEVFASHLYHTHFEVGLWCLCSVGIGIHFIAGTSQFEECQILEHYHHSCRLAIVLTSYLKYAFPVAFVHTTVHPYLLVECHILVPPLPATPYGNCGNECGQNDCHPWAGHPLSEIDVNLVCD